MIRFLHLSISNLWIHHILFFLLGSYPSSFFSIRRQYLWEQYISTLSLVLFVWPFSFLVKKTRMLSLKVIFYNCLRGDSDYIYKFANFLHCLIERILWWSQLKSANALCQPIKGASMMGLTIKIHSLPMNCKILIRFVIALIILS